MFKFFRKHRTFLMSFLALVAIALPFFGIGGSSLLPSGQDVIVKVNGQKIRQIDFDRIFNQIVRQKKDVKPEEKQQIQQEALNELIREEVMYMEAKNFGIHVSDQELQMHLASVPAFQKDGQFDPTTYVRAVYQIFGTTPHEFEKIRKKDLAGFKLNQLIASTVHVSDDVFQEVLLARLAIETDKKKLKAYQETPESLRQELTAQESNLVFRDWLNQLNSNLKVTVVSDKFRKRLAGES